MSDIVTLNGYNIKDEKAVRSYDTIALMKADTKLKEGYHVKTKGYYETNDGGNGEYVIVDDETLVDDGGSIHVLSNGLRAKLISKSNINTMMFGAKNDKSEDVSTKINNCVTYVANNSTDKIVNFIQGEYLLNSTVNIPIDISVDGHGSSIYVNFNGFAFWINTNGSSWVVAFGGQYFNEFKNFRIYNNDKNTYTGAKGIQLGCAIRITNIYFFQLANAIVQTMNYIDNKYIEKCICFEGLSDYDMILYNGDGLYLCQLMQFKIKISLCGGGNILNCINSSVELNSCSGVNIIGCHNEGNAHFKVVASRCSFKDIFINRDSNYDEAFEIKTADNISSCVTMENIEIRYLFNNSINTELNDISIDNTSSLTLRNVYDYLCENGGLNGSPVGFKLNNELYYNSNLIINRGVNQSNLLCIANESVDYNFPINLIQPNTDYDGGFNISDGLIYYRARQFYDIERLIMIPYTNNNNPSITISSDNQSNTLIMTGTQIIHNGIVRLYRGDSQNNYDKYVDIPMVGFATKNIIDNKSSIHGCYFWKNRETGDSETGITTKYFEKKGNNVIIKSTTTPIYGTWTKGDIIINSNPSVSNPYGWICTESGTPGTWKSLGNIES